jgi:hypothetical protein
MILLYYNITQLAQMMKYALLIAFSAFYILSIGRQLYSSDAQVMYEASRALAFEHTISIASPSPLPQLKLGRDGRTYSQYDPGLPLLAAPLIWLGDSLAQTQAWDRYAFAAYLLAWIPAIGAAAGLAALYELGRGTGYRPSQAVTIVLAAGVASPLWVYARQFFAEGLLAGLLTVAVWGILQKRITWAGIAFGLAILTRAAMLIYLPPLLWLLWQTLPTQGRVRDLLVFGGPCGLALLGLAYHNWLRFGHPLTFGYGGQAFSTPPWEGALGLLFWPDKSLFLFAPPLLASLYAFPRFWQNQRPLAIWLVVCSIMALAFYGSWWAWGGGWAWGPRFLVPLLPLWMLPLGYLNRHVGVGLLIALGIGINGLGVLTDVNTHYSRAEASPQAVWVSPSAIQGAILTAQKGHLEGLGTFALQSIGWLPFPAALFPSGLIAIIYLSGYCMFNRSVSEQRHE